MDIEELRRKAMASMPHKKKQQQKQSQSQSQSQPQPQPQPQKVSSDPQPGKLPADTLFDASVIQTPVISCALTAPSFSGSFKERDVFLATLQDLHPSAISPAAEEKYDNLVIRFSDGESDSDAEETHLKMDERHGGVSFRGNIIGTSANRSPAASSQMTTTSASQHTPGMWNQMAMMKQKLAAVRTSMSSAVQVRGDGPSWKSSSKQKRVIGQKGSIGQKRGVKPGDLDNLRKKIATKGGTDLENLIKQIATKGGTDLENLRKQIATKENELKLQRHMKSGKGQGMVSVPNGKLHIPGIGVSTAGSTGRQLSFSPASLKVAGTSDKETGEEKEKVLQLTVQELPDAGMKVNIDNLQQLRINTFNTDTEYNCAKNGSFDKDPIRGSIDKDPIRDLRSVGSKRPHTEDNPVGRKYQKAAVDFDERNVASTQPVSETVKKHCTKVESNIYSSNFSMSMPASTPSKWVMSEGFHHININCFPEREGNKKCKVDGPSMGSRNDGNVAQGQSSAQYSPEHQKHSSVEGFPNKVNSENMQAISREGEEVQMEIEETERLVMNESGKTADIENCSQKTNSGVKQSLVNYWKNAKEDIDGSSVQPFIEEGCFDLTYGRQLAGPACENMSTSETSVDVPCGAQKTRVPIIFTSREVVEWQGNRGPLSNIRPTGIRIQDDLLQHGNISLQNLMKDEELVDKELEEAREHRRRCEMEETLSWKAYCKALSAVKAANQRYIDLHKKRESLSAQVRAVAMRDYFYHGSPELVEERKEGFYEPRSFLGHNNLSNTADITPSEQPGCKLNEHGSIVDYAITSSSQPCIGNNRSSSKRGFLSVQQNSNDRLPMADVVPNTARESCMADKNIDQGKIYGSVSSGVAADQGQETVLGEPELLFQMSKRKNEMEGKHAVSSESTLKATETFQRCRSKLSDNMEVCKSSEHGLRREDNLLDTIIDTTVENDENCQLMPKLSIAPEILSDEKSPAVDKSGGPDFEQATRDRNCLPQKRKWSNQIPASEFGGDGRAKCSGTSVSKLNLGVDSLTLTERTKKEGTASPRVETSAESLHDQNYDQEYNIQFSVRKHEKVANTCPESLARILEVPEKVVKTTTVGHLIDDDVHGNSVGTCHSEDSLASGIVCEKTNNKRSATKFSSLKFEKANFEENNEERCHSGSSVDEGRATEKENTAIWKNSIEEQATSGNSGGFPDCEQPKLSDLTMLENFNGGSVASDVAYMENQDSMQQIVCAYTAQKTLGENFCQGKIQAADRKYYEDASNQLPESDFWMASSEFKVVFSCVKEILSNSHGISGSSCGKMTQLVLQDLPEYVPKFLLYESPLDMFKSYSIYNNLSAADGGPDKSISCSHLINPFWPLCKFEHRGKCNNEDCQWQHARDYSLTPTKFVEQLKKHSNTIVDGLAGDYKEFNSHDNHDPQIYFKTATKEAITRGFKNHFAVTAGESVVSQGFSCRIISSYGLIVPVYRIGSHLIKADVPMVGALIAQSTWRFWKLGFCQSFPIPFAIQRLLLSDMPYLRSAAVREWMLGSNSRLPTCLYSSSANPDDTKKHLFRGLENVECWLELAVDSMNFDSNIDKLDGRKKALCVLSRAIEANPNSVALWVVYLHMFYRKEKVIGKDDMFHHAVQHNEGSYELWLLFINSRLQMNQRLEAYINAINLLCSKACASEMQDKCTSPYVLDLVLQMLNFLSLSGYKQKVMTWIDELLSCSTESSNDGQSDFISVSTVLACLTRKDACVLWVSCMYFRVYETLPKAIVEWLEFEQNLPFDVEWQSCHISEALIDGTIKLMNNAVSSLNECHDHCSSQSWHNDSNSLLPVHALVINHVKCVSAIEGLMSAHKLCCRYRELYPSCIELVLISSSIESHSGDDRAGTVLFDESLSNWPEGKPGIQRFWNQYVGYVLESKGVDFAKDIINKWFCYMDQHKMLDSVISFRGTDYLTCSPSGHAVEEYKDKRKQAHDFSAKTRLDRRSWCQDMMFALLNLAIYRFLNNDPNKAQSAVDQALKVALDDGDVKHCIRECAALALFSIPDGLELMKNGFDTRMLQLLDNCFRQSQLFPIPKPLSRAFTESIKKPKIRIFIENLLGPIPVDCSLLNSILEIWYGPSLLPKKFGAFKDLVDFLEGFLELAPANLKLVLSISRMIVQRCNSQNISSMAALFWASSLLINSIFQSFPVAPENCWLEVGNFLELLDVDVVLEEFYQQALSVHPFSVALWHSFLNFRRRTENLAGVVEAAKQRGIIID